MRKSLLILICIVFCLNYLQGQKSGLNLKNALIVSQQNDLGDRYSIEVGLLQLFKEYNIKVKSSLDVVKQGGNSKILLEDSIRSSLKDQGFDTYMLISVRGHNQKFKPTSKKIEIEEEFNAGHLFPLYRDGITNVTFSIIFFRDLEPVHYELIKTSSVGSREVVLRKLFKKIEKRLQKDWL